MTEDATRRILQDMGFGHDREQDEFDRRALELLNRLAEALEALAPIQPSNLTGVNLMALPTGPVAPGATGDFTATAVGPERANVDWHATVDVVSSDVTIFTVAG